MLEGKTCSLRRAFTRLYYGERYLGVDFTNKMDAVGIAEAFGIRGVRITDPGQLIPAITDAMAGNEPIFIDVPTKSELEEVPPVHAWQQALKRESTLASADCVNQITPTSQSREGGMGL